MKMKSVSIMFALLMILCLALGASAQDFDETWDENTVLTVFKGMDMYFPDMFADEDSDFLWTEDDYGYTPYFQDPAEKTFVEKAPIEQGTAQMTAEFDPCGDGLIKFDVTIYKEHAGTVPGTSDSGLFYGDRNTTYIRNIDTFLTISDGSNSVTTKLEMKTCESTGGNRCHSVNFRRAQDSSGNPVYQADLKGYLAVPAGLIMTDSQKIHYTVNMHIEFSTYMTALWPVDSYDAYASAAVKPNTKKNYCQPDLELHNTFDYDAMKNPMHSIQAKYDENSGEARVQVVIRNMSPKNMDRNYVIPGEVYAFSGVDVLTGAKAESASGGMISDRLVIAKDGQRITDYKCEYTVYNTANAAPFTDYCRFGEGIRVPSYGIVRIDLTLDHLSGDILRAVKGHDVSFGMRLGGYMGALLPSTGGVVENDFLKTLLGYYQPDRIPFISGLFKPVDYPCPPVSRMQVMDPLKPFMTFYKMDPDNPIKPSGAYGVYDGGVWGMYQKCGKLAYLAVRLKNDGIKDEFINLDHAAVSINGGSPMKWDWAMTTHYPDMGRVIVLAPGEEVTLFCRAKITDYPYQLNADNAMAGQVNFTDFGFTLTGKVYSDHNNTRCSLPPM